MSGSLTVLLLLLLIGGISFRSINQLADTLQRVRQREASVETLEVTLSHLKDAETGTRGFLVTGKAPYLEPYYRALQQIHQDLAHLSRLLHASPAQARYLPQLKSLIKQKLTLSQALIQLRTSQGLAVASESIQT